MKEYSRQHYVPQFYLKLFSPEKDGDYVFCYDKKKRNAFRTNVRQICYEIGFNSDVNKPNKLVEKAFHRLRANVASCL
jgi:hypothetical protein